MKADFTGLHFNNQRSADSNRRGRWLETATAFFFFVRKRASIGLLPEHRYTVGAENLVSGDERCAFYKSLRHEQPVERVRMEIGNQFQPRGVSERNWKLGEVVGGYGDTKGLG